MNGKSICGLFLNVKLKNEASVEGWVSGTIVQTPGCIIQSTGEILTWILQDILQLLDKQK